MAAFKLCFSIRKEFLKKKVSGENAFDKINVSMYKYNSLKAGQLPPQHLSFLENLLNFIITKYLKQACDLSITGDIKIHQCHMIKR